MGSRQKEIMERISHGEHAKPSAKGLQKQPNLAAKFRAQVFIASRFKILRSVKTETS